MKQAFLILFLVVLSFQVRGQDNYEIQVYGSETVEKHYTMVESHTNFTFDGQKATENGVLPTNHIIHETIEITHGFTNWMEVGFYFFNAIGSDNRTTYVGSHIRPRVRVPEKWHWPVGLSLSVEAGYQKPEYSEDDWTLEIRPIIDKQWKKLYLSFNPTVDRSLHGMNLNQGATFSPNFKANYAITKKIAPGLEYYGSTGSFTSPLPLQQQEHMLFITVDLDVSKNWEFNAGYGFGLTSTGDNAIFKIIVGRRFH